MEFLAQALNKGILPAIIVAIYLIIIRFIDSNKEAKQAKFNSDIMNLFNNLNTFLTYVTKDIIEIDKEKAIFAIRHSFKNFGNTILIHCIDTVINNHISENSEIIKEGVESLIESEFFDMYNSLSLYREQSHKVTDGISDSWKHELKEDVLEIIFSDKDKEQKIYLLNKSIPVKINRYINIVINKYGNLKRNG